MSEQLKPRLLRAIKFLAEGHGATVNAVVAQTDLVELECVVAEATDSRRTAVTLDDVAAVVILFLGEAADSLEEHPEVHLEPNRSIAARVALGLADGTRGKPLRGDRGTEGRVATVARWEGCQPASLFKPRSDGRSAFDVLIEDIAEHLFRREIQYLVDARQLAQRARRPPLESAMRVEWISRFEQYARLSACVSGFRFDLELALEAFRAEDAIGVDARLRKALYYFAAYLAELERFYDEHGLLWILPNAQAEDAVSDATWFIRKYTSLGEYDQSILRLAFTQQRELAPFAHATYTWRSLNGIVLRWRRWAESCPCSNLKRPRRTCEVHAALRWATFFMDAMEAQWASLTDWYDVSREGSQVEPTKLVSRSLPVLPPTLDKLS
jgi:hypothetical protein